MSYVRLSGKKRGFFSQYTLWKGGDHVLAVVSNGYSEDYRRFYFKDIQAVIIRPTRRARTITFSLAITAALIALAAFAAAAANQIFMAYLCGIICLSLLIGLLINVLLGPSCSCHLKMPLVTHEMPSLRRLKHAQAMLFEIRPLIRTIQGSLSDEEIKTTFRHLQPGRDLSASSYHSRTSRLSYSSMQEYAGGIHGLLFGLLLIDAALTLAHFYHANVALYFMNMITGIGLFILVIMALIRQKDHSLSQTAKKLTWAVMILLSVDYLLAYCFSIGYFVMARRSEAFQSQWTLFSAMAEIIPAEHPWLAKVYMFHIAGAATFGLCGIISTALWRRQSRSRAISRPAASRVLREEGES